MYMHMRFKIKRWHNFTYRGDACSRKTFHVKRAILKCIIIIVTLPCGSRHHDGGIFFWQSTGKSQEEVCTTSTREVSSTRENIKERTSFFGSNQTCIKERTSFFGSNQTCLTSTSRKSNPPRWHQGV